MVGPIVVGPRGDPLVLPSPSDDAITTSHGLGMFVDGIKDIGCIGCTGAGMPAVPPPPPIDIIGCIGDGMLEEGEGEDTAIDGCIGCDNDCDDPATG